MAGKPLGEAIQAYWRAAQREAREVRPMQKAKCRSCQAEILWVESAASRQLLPLDAEPVEGGTIAIVDGRAVVMGGGLFDQMIPEGPRYRSHFASCKDAAKWRKSKK